MKLLIFSFFIFISFNSIKSICIKGGNCPTQGGSCVNNKCICNDGYYSFNYIINKNDTIFCEYKKMSRLGPLILEFFLPTIGHLYAGKMRLFIAKLIIIIFPFIFYCCGCTKVTTSQESSQRVYTNSIILILVVVLIIILPFFHICDLICYTFGFYNDGNGVPFN